MTTKHNWGILALGGIAHKFASALNSTENGELFAVGSRSIDKAEKFASQYGSEDDGLDIWGFFRIDASVVFFRNFWWNSKTIS